MTKKEQVDALRTAIETDKLAKQKHKAHLEHITILQKQEEELKQEISGLQATLANLQDEIIAALEVKFDYSDDMALAAAEETLTNLENEKEWITENPSQK